MRSKSRNHSLSFFRFIWIIFLIGFALTIVYLYRLQTQGKLMEQFLKITGSIMNFSKKNPQITYVLLSYIPIFYLGYTTGKNYGTKKKK